MVKYIIGSVHMYSSIAPWSGLLRVIPIANSREGGIGFLDPSWKDKRRENERVKKTKEE